MYNERLLYTKTKQINKGYMEEVGGRFYISDVWSLEKDDSVRG